MRQLATSIGIVGVLAGLLAGFQSRSAYGYINTFRPETLGTMCARSDSIAVLKVEKLSKDKGVIIYTKVKDLKGTFPVDRLREILGSAHEAHEKKHYLEWAEEGKVAVCFNYKNRVALCIGDQWTVCEDLNGPPKDKAETWSVTTRTEPFFTQSYFGDAEKLQTAVVDILAEKEVVVPCMAGGRDKELRERKGEMVRMRTSLKIKEYDLKRDRVKDEPKK